MNLHSRDMRSPAVERAMRALHPRLTCTAKRWTSESGEPVQAIELVGTRDELLATGLVADHGLTTPRKRLHGATDSRAARTYNCHGDEYFILDSGLEFFRVEIITRAEDCAPERRVHSAKVARRVDAMLRPFMRGTWRPPG